MKKVFMKKFIEKSCNHIHKISLIYIVIFFPIDTKGCQEWVDGIMLNSKRS